MSIASSANSVPILARVDLLVVGASTAAVEAALAASDTGARVFATSDRPYFGEDSAGAFLFSPDSDPLTPLGRTIFAADPQPPSPLRIKAALESALLERKIPFLFQVRPIALLRDPEGLVAGALFASRSGWFAIAAPAIVDASRHLTLTRLGATTFEALPGTGSIVATLCSLACQRPAPSAASSEVSGPFPAPTWPDAPAEASVWQCSASLDAPKSIAEWARLEALTRDAAFNPHALRAADAIAWTPLDRCVASEPGLFPIRSTSPWSAMDEARTVASAACHYACAARPQHPLQPEPAPGAVPSSQAIRPLPESPRFQRHRDRMPLPQAFLHTAPLLDEVDVLVVGGGTGGAPAAIAAAREGARTLVCETLPGLGGVGTLGMISSYYFGNRTGFTTAIDAGVRSMGPAELAPKEGAWNPEWKMAWLLRATLQAGGGAWFGAFAHGVRLVDNQVAGVLVSTPFGSGLVTARTVIDATGNADVAAAAGAPCRVIGADHVAVQGAGLSPRAPHVLQRNTDHTFSEDGDVTDLTQAMIVARAKFNQEFDTTPMVDTRERRQILSDLELSPLDFLAQRTFPDTITTASSNFDTHGFTVHPAFMVLPPDKKSMRAHVPYRCLVPQQIDGVLVTGLGIGAHRDALPVVRMQADVQNQGFAAGLAAASAAHSGVQLRALDVRALQVRLVEAGVLEPAVPAQTDSFPLPEATLDRAVADPLANHLHVAVLFAESARTTPKLLAALPAASGDRARAIALILGLQGHPDALPVLLQHVEDTPWDSGWNYRGMGQFGASLSPLDASIIALGVIGDRVALPVLIGKADSLAESAAFSHVRAIATALEAFACPSAVPALVRLLQLPGMRGHAWVEVAAIRNTVSPHPNENDERNRALRELHLARALYRCGDSPDSLGRATLEQFASDLRGPFARHAAAVLAARLAPRPAPVALARDA